MIEIEETGADASSGIDALTKSLRSLKSVTSIKSLDKLKNDLAGIITATAPISGNAGKRIKSFADGLTALAAVPKIEGITKTTASQIEAVSNAASGLVGKDFSGMKSLADGLNAVKSVGDVKISSSWANQINAVTTAVTKIDPTTEQKLKALRDGLSPLTSLGKANLTSFTNQLGKLSDVVETLDAADLDKFTSQMQKVTAAISPLADKMNKVSAGFSKFPASVKNVINANSALSTSNTKTAKSFGVMGLGISGSLARFAAVTVVVKQLANVVGGWITETNSYIENLNLFNVSMGRFAEEAKAYAETVGDVMGIDPSDWLRAQGTFQTLATGFGVVSDRAAVMSKNLTQLGYDISSFYNISQSDAMQKLESAFAGELEPVRRLGYDLSQARLEAVTLSLGIDKAVSSMTQAEKAELRYYTLMTQVTQVQGDMARTLEAPANQLRVFQAAVQQASRALGSLFIPALNAVLPYAIAFVKVITMAAQILAGLFGFELPDMDSSSFDEVSASAGGITDEVEGATDAAKELKGVLAGFDEINLIAQPDGGGAGDISAGGGGFDFELPEYDFIDNAMQTKIEQIVEKMKEWLGLTDDVLTWSDFFNTNLGKILEAVGLISAGIAMWKIASAVADADKLSKILGSLGIIALEFVLVKTATDGFLAEGGTIWDLLRALFATGVASWALYTIWGTKGLTIGIGVSMIAMLTSLATEIKSGAVDANGFKTTLVGLVITALGGLMGMTIAKQIPGMAMGTGALFGLSMGAALVLSVTNIAAIAGGQYEADSIFSVIRTILSSVMGGIAGATLLTAFTGLGAGAAFAIGFGVTLVLNVVGIMIGEQKNKNDTVLSKIFDGTGVELEKYVDYIKTGIDPTNQFAQATLEMAKNIEADKEAMEKANMTFDVALEKFKSLPTTAKEAIKELRDAFNEFSSAISQTLGDMSTMLQTDVVGALQNVGDTADGAFGKALEQLYLLDADGNAALAALNKSIDETIMQMEGLDKESSEYKGLEEQLLKDYDQLIGVTSAMQMATPEAEAFNRAMDDALTSDLNFQSVEDAVACFEDLNTTGEQALKALDESYNESLANLENYFATMDALGVNYDVKLYEDLKTLLNKNYEENRAGIESDMKQAFDHIGKQVEEKFNAGVTTAFEEGPTFWEDLVATSEYLYSTKEYEDALYEQAYDTTYKAMGGIVDGAREYGSNWGMEEMHLVGEDLITGVTDGMEEGAPKKSWWSEFWNSHWMTKIKECLGIHSPSTVMRDEVGKPMAEGVMKGFDGLDTEITKVWNIIAEEAQTKANEIKSKLSEAWNSIKTTTQTRFTEIKNTFASTLNEMSVKTNTKFNEMQNKVVNAVGNIKTSMQSKWNEIKSWWSNLTLPSFNIKLPHFSWTTTSVNLLGTTFEIPKLNVAWYANGGFPEAGQMFIARESGPEMVGSIGGRTAVANNDQIVEGISQGVYEAVMSAIANNGVFQRIERNTRAAAEKELVISPSAELGRVNSKSAKMYDKARGYA
ncbi:MAG: hypothetical protein IKY47_03560 [Bacteroidaceae bacterium]|nr:hypothetical protein [Bacteroidaceae bacterium]